MQAVAVVLPASGALGRLADVGAVRSAVAAEDSWPAAVVVLVAGPVVVDHLVVLEAGLVETVPAVPAVDADLVALAHLDWSSGIVVASAALPLEQAYLAGLRVAADPDCFAANAVAAWPIAAPSGSGAAVVLAAAVAFAVASSAFAVLGDVASAVRLDHPVGPSHADFVAVAFAAPTEGSFACLAASCHWPAPAASSAVGAIASDGVALLAADSIALFILVSRLVCTHHHSVLRDSS